MKIFDQIQSEATQARDEYDRKMLILYQQVSMIQEECEHKNIEYTPDASGNNDSSTDCLDCGAVWSKRKQKFIPDPISILHWSP